MKTARRASEKMSGLDSRRGEGDKLCRCLVRQLSGLVSPGIGRWAPVWEIVEGPSYHLLKCLEGWEQTGDQTDLDRAKAASQEVLAAWKEAESRFQEQGARDTGQPDRSVVLRRLPTSP